MTILRQSSLCLLLSLTCFGCSSDDDPSPTSSPSLDASIGSNPIDATTGTASDSSSLIALNPDTAPVASVDRFQDSFGKLFKRSGPAFNPAEVSKVVPAPNAPIDMENFLVKAWGPTGEKLVYYSLDIVADVPAQAYVVVDQSGTVVDKQLPIIDGLPGDASYNDFVLVTEIKVKPGYVVNSLTGFDDVTAAVNAGLVTLEPTTRVENWSVVPAGTTAPRKFLGKSPTGYRAWSRHQVAHFLRFDTDLVVRAGKIPTSPIIVIFKNDTSPAEGFLSEPDGMTHNAVATVPGQPGYSSYWDHSVGKASGFDSVKDFATASANVREKVPVIVNCPVVE